MLLFMTRVFFNSTLIVFLLFSQGCVPKIEKSETEQEQNIDDSTSSESPKKDTAPNDTDSKSSDSDSSQSENSGSTTIPIESNFNWEIQEPPKEFSAWESKMIKYGQMIGESLLDGDLQYIRRNAYYDGLKNFLNIAECTGETEPWNTYAERSKYGYITKYYEPNDYKVPGYMRFTEGAMLDWKKNGAKDSYDAIVGLREKAAYSDPLTNTWADGWYKQKISREVAYALENQVAAARVGAGLQEEKVAAYLDMALGHIEIWTTQNYISTDPSWQFCQSFMAGLTATALINYQNYLAEQGKTDERILPAIKTLADWLWETAWIPNPDTGYGAFKYVNPAIDGVGSEGPAPDLNNLISPMYGWLYLQTGDERYKERGDLIFNGGIESSYMKSGKVFNQNYRNSFDYLKYRELGIRKSKN